MAHGNWPTGCWPIASLFQVLGICREDFKLVLDESNALRRIRVRSAGRNDVVSPLVHRSGKSFTDRDFANFSASRAQRKCDMRAQPVGLSTSEHR